ncbi:MAG: sensor histidine kinase [Saprospiraceae bacterium]
MYELAPEKIDGYWKFRYKTESIAARVSQIYVLFFSGGITLAVMLVEIIRRKKDRIPKILALLCFLVLPVLQSLAMESPETEKWRISNSGIVLLTTVLSITWFVSNYRFLYNPFNRTIKDLLDSISDLAFFTDPKFDIINKNQIAAQEFGALRLEKNILTILSKNSQLTLPEINALVEELEVGKKKTRELKLCIDGKEKIYQLKIAKFERGNLHLGYTFILTNLTEILEREKELKVANTIKDNLFAIISHDLRKPALAFRGISKKVNYLLQEKRFDTLNQYGHSLEKAAYSLNNLLDNLLKWALQQKDILPYRPINIKVGAATQEILMLFNQMAADKNISLNITIDDSATVFVDENAYATIIRNLVDNAIKYTPDGGHIALSVEQLEQTIIIRVEDSGIGIAPDKMDTLFELKPNKSKRGTAGEKGTGLGLTLVKDLVKLNKGLIKVRNNWHHGATFELELPIV